MRCSARARPLHTAVREQRLLLCRGDAYRHGLRPVNATTVGNTVGGPTPRGDIFTYDSSGNATLFFASDPESGSFSTPRIAPDGFGAYGGQLIVTQSGTNRLLAIDSGGNASVVAAAMRIGRWKP